MLAVHPARCPARRGCVTIASMSKAPAAGLLLVVASCLAACASPARHADELARGFGFEREIVGGEGFRHLIYRNTATTTATAGAAMLHVYIEGDGTPYRRPDTVAADPTPRNPLMLRLMALDPSPSIYLGRPCYFEPRRDPACDSIYWTLRRFGPEVLASMEAVLRAERMRAGASRVELFGHSGGGTLAVLLAQRIDEVSKVVTIGANLDLAAWCRLHGYSPLSGSLSPVDLPPPRAALEILHLVGADDTNTPPSLVIGAARARGGEPVRVLAHQNHSCCWEAPWPSVLSGAL
jgi:pimeloyl-ACP methyl ester carboxylesterase